MGEGLGGFHNRDAATIDNYKLLSLYPDYLN